MILSKVERIVLENFQLKFCKKIVDALSIHIFNANAVNNKPNL